MHGPNLRFFLLLLLGLGLWFCPVSDAIPTSGWHVFSLFLTTVIGVILKPFPMSALCLMTLAVATGTNTLTLKEVLDSFHSEIVWLVVFAFFISRGFIQTGLGQRIAYYFVSLLGKSSLGLSYGLLISETILAPAIPSVTARAGGIIFPVAKGIAQSFGSDPKTGTSRLIGSFLMKSAYQGSIITSAMFLTAMAANPLIVAVIGDAGYSLSWGTWAIAAAVPGFLSLLIMPYLLYKLYPPHIHVTPHAAQKARESLAAMGKLTRQEWSMLAIFLVLVALWIFGSILGIKATTAALMGVAAILALRILSWDDILSEKQAWDTFIWFATLVMLASALAQHGFTPWLSGQVSNGLSHWPWHYGFIGLAFIYFFSHYLFASSTAHVGAMYPAFLMMAIQLGTPPYLAILVFAFSSSLFGGLTHYGSGQAPLFYGSGYIEVNDWWKYGFILSLVNILIWFGIGTIWWRFLGLW